MPFTSRQLFLKIWFWSLIGSASFVALYLFIVFFGGLLEGPKNTHIFENGFLLLSIIGSIAGAGLVGWRVVDNYQHAQLNTWFKRYLQYSLLGIVLAIGLSFTPLSRVLGLWSFVAALTALRCITPNTVTKRNSARKL